MVKLTHIYLFGDFETGSVVKRAMRRKGRYTYVIFVGHGGLSLKHRDTSVHMYVHKVGLYLCSQSLFFFLDHCSSTKCAGSGAN